MQGQSDTVMNQGVSFGYSDGLNRLTSRTVTSGTVQNYTYAYDRYGNRVSQTPLQGGYSFNPTINAANNQITISGYKYDAAGNMTNDTVHSYTYDAEGNLTQVDGGSTAQYVYDVFNHRIHVQTASATNEYVYDPMGRRVSTWLSPTNFGSEGRIYWDGQQVAYRSMDGTTYFDHQDMLGTERMRTTYSGAVGSTYTSLPWGDGYTATVNTTGADQDNGHFAGLDRDAESDTEHAQFRNYASAQGRWLAPDPYMGSYDLSNPQSMNRYAYALNNPGSLVDPSGLKECELSVYGFCFSVTVWDSAPYDGDLLSLDNPIPVPTSDRVRGTTTGNAPNNGRNCSAGPASAGQYVAATAEVATLTSQYASGLGPGNRTFGPGTATSAVMGQSAGVQDVLNNYYMTGQTSGLYTFGAAGAVSAGGNPVAQFVGSFRWSMSGGVLSLTNTTSFRSLTYDAGPQWQRSSFGPGGNTHQTYQVGVVCH